jgi:hypothetical protein
MYVSAIQKIGSYVLGNVVVSTHLPNAVEPRSIQQNTRKENVQNS